MFLKLSYMEMKTTPKFALLLTLSFITELVETAKQHEADKLQFVQPFLCYFFHCSSPVRINCKLLSQIRLGRYSCTG